MRLIETDNLTGKSATLPATQTTTIVNRLAKDSGDSTLVWEKLDKGESLAYRGKSYRKYIPPARKSARPTIACELDFSAEFAPNVQLIVPLDGPTLSRALLAMWDCGYHFQSLNETAPLECPDCGGQYLLQPIPGLTLPEGCICR